MNSAQDPQKTHGMQTLYPNGYINSIEFAKVTIFFKILHIAKIQKKKF